MRSFVLQSLSVVCVVVLCSYCILGDGCMMEGISNEACSLAGHWGLGKLIALYDDNNISIDGHTEISFTEDVAARFEALGWHVQHVKDGNTDFDGLRKVCGVICNGELLVYWVHPSLACGSWHLVAGVMVVTGVLMLGEGEVNCSAGGGMLCVRLWQAVRDWQQRGASIHNRGE